MSCDTCDCGVSLGAIGVKITITIVECDDAGVETVVDISAATTMEIHYKKPDGSVVGSPWTAAFETDGTDGKLSYTTGSGDLDVAGWWQVQGRVVTPAPQDYRSCIGRFKVEATL